MEYNDVIIHSVNLHTLMHVTRILNELIEIIEDTYKIDAIRVNTSQNLVEANYTIANMEYFNDDYPRFQFQNFESGVSEFCNWLKQYEQRLCHEK